jgi:hypothetical protein
MSDAELRDLVASLAMAQKETDRLQKETDRQFKETDRRFEEVARQSKETDRRFEEVARQSIETDQRLNELAGMFGDQIGRLAEAIVEPACLRLFRERGIAVTYSTQRAESAVAGEEMEIDVLLANGTEVVAVEVKTSLGVRDVNRFLERLGRFRKAFPQFRDHVLYGAVAGLQSRPEARHYAARKGLLVLKPSGSMVEVANTPDFRPKQF